MQQLIFHVDVNSAYLSWEATRRVKAGEEDLRLIPSAIGGDREKRTGVILAKSIPAKKCGVKTGEPVGMALRKCPELVLARPDFQLYEQCSKAFMDICRKYAPVVERYSIDECFLDLSGTQHTYPDPVALAHRIKDEIRDTLGFTVNIGIGSNKLLAKMASDFEKPDKVHTLYSTEIPGKLWPLPVGELFSVGYTTVQQLQKASILTVGDLAQTELSRVQRLIGVKFGQQIHAYANGIDHSPVLAQPEEAKGYSISTTTEEDVTTAEAAARVLLALTDSVAARMRADGAKACCVAVTIRGNDFRNHSHQVKLPTPTDITDEIYKTVKSLFAGLWDRHTPMRLLGVALTQITRGECDQLSLFTDPQKERAKKLDKAVDGIRKRYGIDAVSRGSTFGSTQRIGRKYKAQMQLSASEQNKK